MEHRSCTTADHHLARCCFPYRLAMSQDFLYGEGACGVLLDQSLGPWRDAHCVQLHPTDPS